MQWPTSAASARAMRADRTSSSAAAAPPSVSSFIPHVDGLSRDRQNSYAAKAIALVVELVAFGFHLAALPKSADALRRAGQVVLTHEHVSVLPASMLFYEGSCHSLHADLRSQTFSASRRILKVIFVLWSVNVAMLSLAMLLDWPWYPRSVGAVSFNTPAEILLHATSYINTGLTLLTTLFLFSRRCTADTYQWVLLAYVATLVTLYAMPFERIDPRHTPGCAVCSSNRTAAHLSGVISRPFGLILEKDPNPLRLDLIMAPGVEAWMRSSIGYTSDENAITVAFTAAICALPIPPLSTLALTVYFTQLRWWRYSTRLSWQLSGSSIRSCCRLAEPLPFPFSEVLLVAFVFTLYRQSTALQICQLKRLQQQMAYQRIEQLGKEKERLDYERALALKRLSPRVLNASDSHAAVPASAPASQTPSGVTMGEAEQLGMVALAGDTCNDGCARHDVRSAHGSATSYSNSELGDILCASEHVAASALSPGLPREPSGTSGRATMPRRTMLGRNSAPASSPRTTPPPPPLAPPHAHRNGACGPPSVPPPSQWLPRSLPPLTRAISPSVVLMRPKTQRAAAASATPTAHSVGDP